MAPPNPLQQLRDIDRSSPQFHEQLHNFLRGDAYRNSLQDLRSEDLMSLVEYLDSVLGDISNHAIPVFRESLRELRDLCSDKGVLPNSWTLSGSLLGCVYEGTFGGSKVRIRRVRMYSGGDPQKVKAALHKVVVISKRSAHPNIVPLLGVTMEPLELISDWMPGGNLPEYIAMHTAANRLSLLSDVAEGLNYLHSYNVIHGDLKGSNILVDVTDRARITDFGLAMVTQGLGSMRSASSESDRSAGWIAPEILTSGKYSKEGDIFSFAGVTIEVFTGAVPFSDRSSHNAESAVERGERPPRPDYSTLTDQTWSLIQQCWNKEARLRPHALRVSYRLNGTPLWKCLVDRSLTSDERASLITDIFSDQEDTEIAKGLNGDDAQTFVDVIYEMLDTLTQQPRRKCLRVLRAICGQQVFLPRSVQITPYYDRSSCARYGGGFADVWEGQHQGAKVAVKVLRVSERSNLDKIRKRFCKEVMMWKSLDHQNVLPLLGATMSDKNFTMISEWMENGNVNEFIKKHEGVNRFELLKDVSRGLIYLHDQKMVHADIKGVNILIDQTYHARLADFGLLTFAVDPSNPTASISTASLRGTIRWMSPELLYPEGFGLKECQPTKESDCYALGMVILEVLSGQYPFARHMDPTVIRKVTNREHPEETEEMRSTGIWETLKQCWSFQPEKRPTAEVILERLESVSPTTIVDSYEPAQHPITSRPFTQGTPSSFHNAIFLSMEGQTTAARMDRSGEHSLYLTAITHPVEEYYQENPAGIANRASDHLEQDPLESIDPISRNDEGTFPGVTVQPGVHSGADSNNSPSMDDVCSESCKKLQATPPLQRADSNILPALESLVTKNCIETLLKLDRSSPQFSYHLAGILARREFDEALELLQTNLVPVIEYLDKALDSLSPASLAFGRAHRKLQGICVPRMLLPSSHVLLNDTLKIDKTPFTSSGFSDTYGGTYKGQEVCVKKLRASGSNSEQAKKMICREALMWKRLIHPNIVPFVGVIVDPPKIASEWMPNGNLTTYIKLNPQQDPVSLLADVAKGLDYLHSHGVIHGDLKGPNVLVDDFNRACITDFCLAQDTLGVVSVQERQSVQWTAPEVLGETQARSTETDVFSFGMVMVEAFTGMAPFSDHNSSAAMVAIISGKRPLRPTHSGLTSTLWELMERCWDQDRHNRPRMLEVLLALKPPILERTHASGPLPVTVGAQTPVSDIQRCLKNLDPSNEEYRPLLYALLSHQDLRPYVSSLREDGLQGFVELLDEALNLIPVTDDLFRKALHRLQSTCGNHRVLPRSYLIPGGILSNRGKPFAAGDSTDASEAEFNGKKVCIKTLRLDVQRKTFYTGVIVWKRLQHPNIVPFLGILSDVPPLEIVCNWMKNGRITEYARTKEVVDRIGLLWDVAEALHHLHSYNIIHGNLKGANVLIDENGHARLADFGLASIVPGNQSIVSLQDVNLTIATTWAAPETSMRGFLTKAGDVFAFAMVAAETFAEYALSTKCYAAVLNGEHPEQPAKLGSGLWNLMQSCWSRDPGKRPTSFELVGFFRQSLSREREMSETQTLSSGVSDEPSTYAEGKSAESHSELSARGTRKGRKWLRRVSESPGPSSPTGPFLGWLGKRMTDPGSSEPAHKPAETASRRRTLFGSGS